MKHFLNHKTESKTYVSSTGDQASGFLQDIVREIGLSLSRSQEILDKKWIEAQRAKLQDLISNPDLILPPSSSFVLPEANLDLNMEIMGNYDSEGNFKIETRPHNAETRVKSRSSQNISSKVSLKFVMVPEQETEEEKEISSNAPKADYSELLKLADEEIEKHNGIKKNPKINHTNLAGTYIPASRKWHLNAYDGNEEVALLLFDDTTSEFLNPILLLSEDHRTIDDVSVLTSPDIQDVKISDAVSEVSINNSAISGQTIVLKGENLGALAVEDTVVKVNGIRVALNEVSFEEIRFKVTPQITGGIIEVTTPEGSDKYPEPLKIRATPLRFDGDSGFGFFNPDNKQGSLIKIHGENISGETKLVFANNATAVVTSFTSQYGEFRVPENAVSGQLRFLTGTDMVTMDPIFYTRPFIKSVEPKEARAKELVRIIGNHFNNIQEIRIGERSFEIIDEPTEDQSKIYAIKSDKSLLLEVPIGAGDGRLFVQSNQRWWDTFVFFYQVPGITNVPDYLIEDVESQITGHGFGKTRQGVYLEQQGYEGIKVREAAYISEIEHSEAQKLGFKTKRGFYTSKIRVIRTDILDLDNIESTTTQWNHKTPVFQHGTLTDQIIWCSPEWIDADQHWTFRGIELQSRGVLKCLAEALLEFKTSIPSEFSFFGEFYNTANVHFQFLPEYGGNDMLTIDVTGESVQLAHKDNEEKGTVAKYDFPEKQNTFEKLIIRFHLLGNTFSIHINKNEYLFDLTSSNTISKALSKFRAIEKWKFKSSSAAESYISSIVISKYPTLLLPELDKMEWDFELADLLKEDTGFKLQELKAHVTPETEKLTISGSGFTIYATAVINQIRCLTKYISETELEVDIYPGAVSGELFVMDYLNTTKQSNPIAFKVIQSGTIQSVSPESVKAGETIIITGEHLTDRGIPKIYVGKFGPLQWSELTNELIEVTAPKLTLINGILRLEYPDGGSVSAQQQIDITSLHEYDFLRMAYHSKWVVPIDLYNPTELPFGSMTGLSEGLGAVTMKNNVKLDDGQFHSHALVVTCPNSEYHYIESRFEDFYIPKGAELIFKLGFLEEARQTDGVIFSVFLELENRNVQILTPVFEGYGGELTEIKTQFNQTEEKGTLVMRIEPGSSGFDDHLAIVKAEMKFTHVEDGWTWLFGSEKTNLPTIPGIRTEPDPKNMPGARSFASVWHANDGSIWLYGGNGKDVNPRSGRLNDLWKYDGDNWTWMGGTVGKNGYSKFGEIPGEAITPGGREASVYWQDSKGVFWLFGGHGYHEGGRQRSLNDLWKIEDGEWRMVAISKGWKDNGAHGIYGETGTLLDHYRNELSVDFWPLTRSHAGFYYDEETDLLWVFGGFYDEPDLEFRMNDLWTFDGKNWELKSGSDSEDYEPVTENEGPSARSGSSLWTDNQGRLFVFGGYGILNGILKPLNDLWRFDEQGWNRIESNMPVVASIHGPDPAKRPGPRAYSATWKDSEGTIWLFGGDGSNIKSEGMAPLSDLWKYEDSEWTLIGGPIKEREMGNLSAPKIPYPDSWPSARYGTSTWISPAGWLMMFGGKGYGEHKSTGNKSLGDIQQLWQFSPEIGK
ncbi:MAG: kelch repeat-containing protein [Cyclobacteriaceae bacterium]